METQQSNFSDVVALLKDGRYQESLELACLQLQRSPDNGKLWEIRGLAHDALGHGASAIDALENATLLVPLSAAGQCVLAKCYESAGKRALARDMYHYLLSLESLPDSLWGVIAAGLGRVGDAALALEACRRAAARELDSGQPFFGMAHYMARLNYPLETIAAVLRKAVDIEPDRFPYRFALATVCRQLGRRDEAYQAIRAAVNTERLREIRCARCLRGLETILREAGDDVLSGVCRRHLAEIKSCGQPDDDGR